jgi:hypothetical protein
MLLFAMLYVFQKYKLGCNEINPYTVWSGLRLLAELLVKRNAKAGHILNKPWSNLVG